MPLAKVTTGRNTLKCLTYVLQKDQSELLETNCAGRTPQAIAQEFAVVREQHLRNGAKKHTTLVNHHFSIAFASDPGKAVMQQVFYRFLELMDYDITQHQYVLARHHDTDDPHLHAVVHRLTFDGRTVDQWQSKRRAEVAMRTIEVEFGFPQLQCSWEVSIKAPTVAEVRRSREKKAPIPRQVIQEVLERTVSGCRTLEALQTALQAEAVTLILTPILPDTVPTQRSKRKRKQKGREKAPTGEAEAGDERHNETGHGTGDGTGLESGNETGIETGNERGDEMSLEEAAHVHLGTATLSEQQPEALKAAIERHPNPLPIPTEQATLPSQASTNPTRYQLVYQWTPPDGKVQTFSASALGKRYTQRGLQERWGVGLQGHDWVEWAAQQSVKPLFTDPLAAGVETDMPLAPVEPGVSTVECTRQTPDSQPVDTSDQQTLSVEQQGGTPDPQTVDVPAQQTAERSRLDMEAERPLVTGNQRLKREVVGVSPVAKVELPPVKTSTSSPTESQQAAHQYYQAAWLKLEQAYTQATGQTRATDPQFEVRVLSRAREQWAVDQCIAMLATTANGQTHVSQGREAFTTYVQGLFGQLTAVQKQEAAKIDQER